ncbi:hypothetical protein BJ166DRAFT_182794 [Pestalotiopsis sp. NC0098]|nr:hypothetical protein BJ166DRAFT_182794 [Pestalotiopsis sp. NC0098]
MARKGVAPSCTSSLRRGIGGTIKRKPVRRPFLSFSQVLYDPMFVMPGMPHSLSGHHTIIGAERSNRKGLTRPEFQGCSPPIAVSAFFPSGLRYGSHSSLSSLPGSLRCTSMLRYPAPLLSEPTGIIKPQHTAQEPFPASKPPSFLVAIPGKLLFCCPSFCGGAWHSSYSRVRAFPVNSTEPIVTFSLARDEHVKLFMHMVHRRVSTSVALLIARASDPR